MLGAFRQAALGGGMAGMTGMCNPPALSLQRLGFGPEMIGALGNNHRFGFDWPSEQQYPGPVFGYALSRSWTAPVELAFGLNGVSDLFVLPMGVVYYPAKIGISSGVGAAAAAGAGTGVMPATRGDPAVIPSEIVLNFALGSPVTVAKSRRSSLLIPLEDPWAGIQRER